jgi:hypothetical protein
MLFARRRGIPLTLALATTLGLGLVMARSARADGMLFQHTITREVDAYDFRTGKPYMAPPVPYGHYAADYIDELHKSLGCATCSLHGLMGGGGGHSFFHKGDGAGGGCGHGAGCGHGGSGCLADGNGIGCGAGHGLFGHGGSAAPGILGADPGFGAGSAGYATTWAQPSGQVGALPSGQSICGQAGCDIAAKHSHLSQMLNKIRCGSCGGSGCGACAGTGATGLCGDPGCSLGAGHGHGGTGCGLCGGKGCASCLSGLKAGLLGKFASIGGVFNKPKISWFNGAGGPVPITPGYVPYIVTTRSPRDFFSFPPMNPDAR